MFIKHSKLVATFLIVIVVTLILTIWLGRSKPVKVITSTVDYGSVQDTVANTRAGTIKACRRAGISPSIGGQIASLPVKEGDEVTKGQVLMELWNEDLLAQKILSNREAIAAKAKAEQACILAEVAKREALRLQKMKKKGLVSEEGIDKAEGEAHAQMAACNAALATAEVSKAKVDVAQAKLERTRLTAPFAGTVAEVNGEIGEFITPSPVGIPTPPAVDLVDITCLYVSAPIDEVDASKIRVGMSVNISLDAFAKQTFKGEVRRVAPYVKEMEKQARTVDVEVDFIIPEDCQCMLPGYSTDIEVILKVREHILRIPTEAILEGNKILVFTEDGLLEERKIKTGLSNWTWTEVTDDLRKDEEVVVSVEREGVADGVTAVRDTQTSDND